MREARLDSAKGRVRQLMLDGEWHTGPDITAPETGGSEGLRRLRELRADGAVIEKRRKTEGVWEYRMLREDPAVAQGKPGWGAVSGHITQPPVTPIPVGTRGQAMAMAAWALSTMAQWPVRLCWCVDLARDVGPDADKHVDPSAPKLMTAWGSYLHRLRNALDAQPWGSKSTCHVAMIVRYRSEATEVPVECTFSLPWYVNLARLTRAPPPVGCWRLVWEPEREEHPIYGHRSDSMPFEGDHLPDIFWFSGIPF